MAIKYNSKQVKVVKFDNNDVKKIIKDGTTIWEKPYTLTESSADPSIVTYKWKTTYEPSATTGGTISKSEKTKNQEYTAEVFNEDTVTLTYNTDISHGAIADIVRVGGVEKASGSNFTVSGDVAVEVIAAGKPATLNLTTDLGVDRAYVRYVDIDGQRRQKTFDEATTHTISDIWQGSTVTYWWYAECGQEASANTPAASVTHTFTAEELNSIELKTIEKGVSLRATWSNEEGKSIESIEVRYTDVNNTEQKRTITQTGIFATDVKLNTQYYWTIKPKAGASDAVFKYLEDYDVAERSVNTISIDVDWTPCTIRIDWPNLAEEVNKVRVKYRSAESNGVHYKNLYRDRPYSIVEKARVGTEAQLVAFWYTKAGCRVDPLDPDAFLTLSTDPTADNVFRGLTVQVLDLDERDTAVTLEVPSDYTTADITYINIDGEEVTITVQGGKSVKIEDMAEGSYVHYVAIDKNGSTHSGTLSAGYDWDTGSATTSSIKVPNTSRPKKPNDDYVYTWNKTTQTWEKTKIDNPRLRPVELTLNQNIYAIRVTYYDVDADGYLRHYTSKRFTANTNFNVLTGHCLTWRVSDSIDGGQVAPKRETFSPVRESKSPLVINPIWSLTTGSIGLVFGENINTITVEYYYTLEDTRTETYSREMADDAGLFEITDVILGTKFNWWATSVDGAPLDRESGVGKADPDYIRGSSDGRADRCALIAPEIDTEPYRVYFRGDYTNWTFNSLEAGLYDEVNARFNENDTSRASLICTTPDGATRWINNAVRISDTSKMAYDGDASFDNTFPITLTPSSDAWNATKRKYVATINSNGFGIKKLTVSRPTELLPGAIDYYVSSDKLATSGDPVTAEYECGSKVYLFISYPYKYSIEYDIPTEWKEVAKSSNGNYVKYRIAAADVLPDSNTVCPFAKVEEPPLKAYTITFDGDYVTWTVDTAIAKHGDSLTVSGLTVVCSRNGKEVWTNTAALFADTVKYDYSGTLKILTPPSTVEGALTITADGGKVDIKQYAVSFNKTSVIAAESLFLSTNKTATSGKASGSTFDYDAEVYGIAKVLTSNVGNYIWPDNWKYQTADSTYTYFSVGSCKVADSTNTITVLTPTVKETYTVTLAGTGVVWKYNNKAVLTMEAYKGDSLVRVNSSTTACAYQDSSGNLAERWRITASIAPATVQYTYSGTAKVPADTVVVTNNVKLTATGITPTLRKYPVNITKPLYVSEVFSSTNASATSGNASGYNYEYGTKVYSFCKISNTILASYTVPNGYTNGRSSGDYMIYQVGYTGTNGVTGSTTVSPAGLNPKTFTITFTGSYVKWTSSTKQALAGDTLSYYDRVVTCKRGTDTVWTNTVTRFADTAQYTYTGTPSVLVPAEVMGNLEIYPELGCITRTTNSYSVTLTKPTNVESIFSSTSASATSGNSSGYKYNYGTRVYVFCKVKTSLLSSYNAPEGYSNPRVSGDYTIYTVKDTGTTGVTGDITLAPSGLTPKSWTLTFTGTYVNWSSSTKTVLTGDVLTVENNTVKCTRGIDTIWTNTARLYATTAQYSYGGTLQILAPNIAGGNATIEAKGAKRTLRSYTIKYTPLNLTGVTSVFLADSSTATTGTSGSSGKSFDYGKTAYCIAKMSNDQLATYAPHSDWTVGSRTNSYAYYVAAQTTVTGAATLSLSNPPLKTERTITLDTTCVTWAYKDPSTNKNMPVSSMKAYDGDAITSSGSSTLVCAYQDARGNLAERWRVTLTKRSNSAQYTYSGTPSVSNINISPVSKNETITPSGVSRAVNKYTITWKNADGTVLETDTNVEYGTTPVFNGSTPTKAKDAQYTYTFSGWSPTVSTVSGAATYTAQYSTTVNKYTVTWKSQDGTTTLETDNNVAYGTKPTYNGVNPSKSSTIQYNFTFNGWSTSKNATSGTASGSLPGITGATTYYAAFTPVTRSYAVSISAGLDWYEAYLSTSPTATSGYSSGRAFSYGSTVYGFAKIATQNAVYYNVPKSWVHIQNTSDLNYAYYQVGKVENIKSAATITYTDHKLKPQTVSISGPSYAKALYTSTSSSATSGNVSGHEYDRGLVVYGFIAIDTNYFSPDSKWAAVGKNSAGYQCYKASSVLTDTTKTTTSKIITVGNAIGKAVTVNLKTTDSYVSWKVNSTTVTSQTAYNGDTLERSGTSLICKDQSGVTRWTAIATKASDTTLYSYTWSTSPYFNMPSSPVMSTSALNVTAVAVTRAVKAGTVTFAGLGGTWKPTSIQAKDGDYVTIAKGAKQVMVASQDGSSITGTASFTPKTGTKMGTVTATNELGESATNASGKLSLRVAGNTSVTVGAGTTTKYTVSISKGTGIDYAWVSKSSSSTSYSTTTSLSVASGTTVYGYVRLSVDSGQLPSTWVLQSGTLYKKGSIYRIGSKKVTNTYNFGTIKANQNIGPVYHFVESGTGTAFGEFSEVTVVGGASITRSTETGSWTVNGTTYANRYIFTIGSKKVYYYYRSSFVSVASTSVSGDISGFGVTNTGTNGTTITVTVTTGTSQS